MTVLQLDDPVTSLEGVGSKLAAALRTGLGIRTVRDLVEHYPRRYQDLGAIQDLAEVAVGEPATLVGTVIGWSQRRTARRRGGRPLTISEARVRQASGAVLTVTFFNQAWRQRSLPPGTAAAFSGTVERFRSDLRISSPEVQVLGRGDVDTGALDHQRLLPIYPATESVPTWRLATLVEAALAGLGELDDYLDEQLLDREDLLSLDTAVRAIHAPDDERTRQAARRRLVFDELFTLQLGLQWRRARLEAETAGVRNRPQQGEDARRDADRFLASLPFAPTAAQRRAIDEIAADLEGDRPMHRLLQGDVGSGKTLVAVWAMLSTVDAGRQAAMMVPTEVLAEQHARTLTELLAPVGVNVLDGVRVAVLTSSTATAEKRRILGELLSGQLDIVVGTHALLEEGVRFADLGLVVIDEQHRFGVSQRVGLKEKRDADVSGRASLPDVLVMTATPIPRSLALTLYGDLDVTVLDELPPGREPVVTQLITPGDAERRERLYAFVREQAAAGHQAYVVCPLIEPSDDIPGRAAVDEHRRLAQEVLPDLEVELVHGRMSSEAKEAAMARFRRGEAHVLVSTTVIEVGVDVPNATVMVIEDAERFGISQLHQLRGRVGRGAAKSYCVLFAGWSTDELTEDAVARLEAVASTTDGFELAERDLEIRGEGTLFGVNQSGLPDLRLARLLVDRQLVERTRELAQQVVTGDPDLSAHHDLRAEVLRRYEGGLDEFAALETG